LTTTGWQKVTLGTAISSSSDFSSSTFTAPVTGVYSFYGSVRYRSTPTAGADYGLGIFKNGSILEQVTNKVPTPAPTELDMQISCMVYLAATDTIELHAYATVACTIGFTAGTNNVQNRFAGYLVSM
jgi:hypothetical protein